MKWAIGAQTFVWLPSPSFYCRLHFILPLFWIAVSVSFDLLAKLICKTSREHCQTAGARSNKTRDGLLLAICVDLWKASLAGYYCLYLPGSVLRTHAQHRPLISWGMFLCHRCVCVYVHVFVFRLAAPPLVFSSGMSPCVRGLFGAQGANGNTAAIGARPRRQTG